MPRSFVSCTRFDFKMIYDHYVVVIYFVYDHLDLSYHRSDRQFTLSLTSDTQLHDHRVVIVTTTSFSLLRGYFREFPLFENHYFLANNRRGRPIKANLS